MLPSLGARLRQGTAALGFVVPTRVSGDLPRQTDPDFDCAEILGLEAAGRSGSQRFERDHSDQRHRISTELSTG